MTYRVEVTDRAFEMIRAQARYIAFDQKASENAKRWLEGIWDAIDSLEMWPQRCPLAPENDLRPYEIRKFNYGNYLILFTIGEVQQAVYVIGFRHGAQQPRPEDLPEGEESEDDAVS